MEHLPSEPAARIPTGLPTDSKRRMQLAKLSGAVTRHDVGMAELLAISRDPAVWGAVLGAALHRAERDGASWLRVVEVARAAGADEQVAETRRAWLRQQPGT